MNGSPQLRSCMCILVASFATGCSSVREFLHLDPPATPYDFGKSQNYPTDFGKSQTNPNDNPPSDRNAATPSGDSRSMGVVPTGDSGPAAYGPPPGGSSPPTQLQAPTPLPTSPIVPAPLALPGGNPPLAGGNSGAPGTFPNQPGANAGLPNAYPGQPSATTGQPSATTGQPNCYPGQTAGFQSQPGAAGSGNPPPPNPHTRNMPTAVGGRLELAPWEYPAERVVELSKQLDTLNALNRSLLTRIRELEANGTSREQAIAEAMRDVERADDEANKNRSSLQLSREEVALLRARLQTMEREDIDTLKLVIQALEKLVPSSGRMP